MKKIFTALCVLCVAMAMQASLHLTIDQWVEDDQVSIAITKDTTIVVTDFEYDEDMDEATMEVRGQLYSDESKNITVTITRQSIGVIDQLCAAGNCVPGNGEQIQVCEFTIGSDAIQRSWFTHYTTAEPSEEEIRYEFNDGINSTITLTVKYSYLMTKVEDVVIPPCNGKIYNLLGQRMFTDEISELPKGIYIINGKKFSKQ